MANGKTKVSLALVCRGSKVIGPVGGEGTHKHTRTRPVSNDSGLLFSREERVMAKMKEEIDGHVRVSVRLYVMSSAVITQTVFSVTFSLWCFSPSASRCTVKKKKRTLNQVSRSLLKHTRTHTMHTHRPFHTVKSSEWIWFLSSQAFAAQWPLR